MVNKNHPGYEKYESEFLNIRDKMIDEINKIEIPKIKGLDGKALQFIKNMQKKLKYCNKNTFEKTVQKRISVIVSS